MAGKIGFVGVGAVGSYYGLMLKKAGEDVHFLLRSNYDAVKKMVLSWFITDPLKQLKE